MTAVMGSLGCLGLSEALQLIGPAHGVLESREDTRVPDAVSAATSGASSPCFREAPGAAGLSAWRSQVLTQPRAGKSAAGPLTFRGPVVQPERRSRVLTGMSEEAMDAGIEVKVEEYDGTYECLFCGESVRGQPALQVLAL